jgi:hypothetical protein
MFTAQPVANCIFQLDCELTGERLAGLHDDKQKDYFVGIMRSSPTDA